MDKGEILELSKYLIDKIFLLFDISRYDGVHLIIMVIFYFTIIGAIVFISTYCILRKLKNIEECKFEEKYKEREVNAMNVYLQAIKVKDEEIEKLKKQNI